MAAAPGAPGPAPLPSGKGPGRGGARNSAPGPNFKGGLFNPSQQLSGKDLSQAATDIANAQTQGPISELAKQIAQTSQQGSAAQSQTFGYYMQLAKEAQDAVNQEQSIGSGLNSQLQGVGQDTSGQLAQFGQQAQQGALGRLSALGLGGDQQAQLQGETARQQGLGALNSGVFRSAGATQGANYAGNAASNLGTFALRGQERLGNIAQATRLSELPLTSKIAALQEKRGALYGTALGQLRSQERNYQVAQEGLGIKQAGLQQTAANNQARNALTARGQNITAQNDLANQANAAANLAERQKNDAATQAWRQASLNAKSGRNGGVKPLTAAQNNAILKQLSEVVNAIPLLQRGGFKDKQGKVTNPHPTEAQIRSLLGGNYSQVLVEAAYELLGYGSIDRQTAENLHNMGIRGGTFRGVPIKVTPNFSAPPAAQAPPGNNHGP